MYRYVQKNEPQLNEKAGFTVTHLDICTNLRIFVTQFYNNTFS